MQIPEYIDNVIFDFGAVILDIDGQRTVDAFRALGVTQFDSFQQFLHSHAKHDLFNDIEKGLINPAKFRYSIRQWSSQELTDLDIDVAWNAMLVGYRKERLDLLMALKNKYRTFLLSNTNVIHWQHFTKMLIPYGYSGLHEFFEKDYYSHELGMRKPDAEIYEYVLEKSNLNPTTTLFLDDNLMNIEGAKKCGIHTIVVTEHNDILQIFKE